MKQDRFNNQILQTLSSNGRITNAELAEVVGLSPSACLRRVQELERQGVIQGYRAVFDKPLLGVGFVAYVMVGLKDHSKSAQREFEKNIMMSDDVIECHKLTGAFEYILRVETRDLVAYKKFHTDVLGITPYVQSINTNVVMETAKDKRA
jgi:Lrp/AsnC family leucine-responsive transcriptional regulator